MLDNLTCLRRIKTKLASNTNRDVIHIYYNTFKLLINNIQYFFNWDIFFFVKAPFLSF